MPASLDGNRYKTGVSTLRSDIIDDLMLERTGRIEDWHNLEGTRK